MKEFEVGETCSVYEGNRKYIQIFLLEILSRPSCNWEASIMVDFMEVICMRM
jgi:hypothetical protein